MSIKKSLLVAAAMALAMMALAPSAMAKASKFVHVTDGTDIPANTQQHYVGWASFKTSLGKYTCHVTSVSETLTKGGTTGKVLAFDVPDTSKCTGTGFASGCKLESHSATTTENGEEVWDITTTTHDLDISHTDPKKVLVLHQKYKNEGFFCGLRGEETTLTFPSITLTPLETTKNGTATNAPNLQGDTAETDDPIAGVKIYGTGTLHREGSSTAVTAEGEVELTEPDRCTWKMVESA